MLDLKGKCLIVKCAKQTVKLSKSKKNVKKKNKKTVRQDCKDLGIVGEILIASIRLIAS